MLTPNTTELTKYETVMDIVNTYQTGQKEIAAAYALLDQAQKRMNGITKYFGVLPNREHYFYDDNPAKNLPSILDLAKRRTWEYILDKTQAPSFMTPKRLKEFNDSLEKPDSLPEITPESIRAFVENVLGAAPDMLLEFIKETFDWLMPSDWSVREYKTNAKSKYELQDKVIKTYLCERWAGHFDIRHSYTANILSMENAFSLLEGKGTRKYPGDAITQIRDKCRAGATEVETEYFKIKFFKNHNCHIYFTRMDLVAKMNQIAGENLVKPAETA